MLGEFQPEIVDICPYCGETLYYSEDTEKQYYHRCVDEQDTIYSTEM